MDRWNELIAGYVLNNLTDEEQTELSAVLAENPQLRLEIVRLRQTATISCTQSLDWSLAHLEAGGEGWADTDNYFPDLSAGEETSPVFQAMATATAAVDGQNADNRDTDSKHINSQNLELSLPYELGLFRYFSLSARRKFRRRKFRRRKFRRRSFLLWIMALLLLCIAVDNCQTRLMLSIAQERILQLERSTERTSDGLNVSDTAD